jgi:hypothetical protein
MDERLQPLLDAAYSTAQEALEAMGQFPPFALMLLQSGEVEFEGLGEEDDVEDAEQAVELVRGRVRARLIADTNIVGAALISDVLLDGTPDEPEQETSAICAHLEHREGEILDVLMPYSVSEVEGEAGEPADEDEAAFEVEYFEPFGTEADRELFAATDVAIN